MYIIKNALKSISRSKGRNILIGIIILVIAVSSCVALSIRNSANEIVSKEKASYDIVATIGVDREALRSSATTGSTDMRTLMDSVPALTVDQLKTYADSQYVKSLNYSVTTSMNSSNVTAVSNSASSSSTTTSGSSSSSSGSASGGAKGMPGGGTGSGSFRLTGYSSTAAMTSFISGTNKITSGSMFSDSDTSNDCVISDELASANSLTVGSTITLTNPNDSTQAYTFRVVGIYTDTTTTSSDGSQMNLFSDSANRIITNYTAANNMITASASNSTTKLTSQLNSSFSLADSTSFDAFKAEVAAKGLNQYYTVTSNLASFETSVKPLTNLSTFATISLLLVLAIGGIILVVLNLINIRERKYEIGVLRAIGMKKGKVALQFITELSIVTIIALFIGSGIGAAASVPTANYMLQSEITTLQTQASQEKSNFGMGSTSSSSSQSNRMTGFFGMGANVSYVSQIDAVINGMVLLEMLGIGIVLVILSSGVSLVFISRYDPLKILSSRT